MVEFGPNPGGNWKAEQLNAAGIVESDARLKERWKQITNKPRELSASGLIFALDRMPNYDLPDTLPAVAIGVISGVIFAAKTFPMPDYLDRNWDKAVVKTSISAGLPLAASMVIDLTEIGSKYPNIEVGLYSFLAGWGVGNILSSAGTIYKIYKNNK